MMDFKLHANDLQIINGDFSICTDESEAIAQAIQIRLRTLKGEWFLDTQVGIPYLTEVLGQKRSEAFLRYLILTEVETIPGVVAIADFSIELDAKGTAHISFNVKISNESSIQINEQIGVKL